VVQAPLAHGIWGDTSTTLLVTISTATEITYATTSGARPGPSRRNYTSRSISMPLRVMV
jgi:hypothetical protein